MNGSLPRSPAISPGRKAGALVFGIGVAVLLVEGVCQLYAFYLGAQWEKLKANPNHYYTASSSEVLGYEMARNVQVEEEGRVLRTNAYGLREADDEIPADKVKIAVFGDSVAFGLDLSQDQTISAMLQQKLDPEKRRVKVLNVGTPGYGTEELIEHLRIKNEVYHFRHVYFVMSPNDFCRRDTVREGGDNGLYRIYRKPVLKSPWMVRKAIYRLMKGGVTSGSIGWHRWVYDGGGERGLADIRTMAAYARGQGATFTVVLMPAWSAYQPGGQYALQDMYDDIMSFLDRNGIAYLDPIAALGKDPDRYLTQTNHLHPEGNEVLADMIRDHYLAATLRTAYR